MFIDVGPRLHLALIRSKILTALSLPVAFGSEGRLRVSAPRVRPLHDTEKVHCDSQWTLQASHVAAIILIGKTSDHGHHWGRQANFDSLSWLPHSGSF